MEVSEMKSVAENLKHNFNDCSQENVSDKTNENSLDSYLSDKNNSSLKDGLADHIKSNVEHKITNEVTDSKLAVNGNTNNPRKAVILKTVSVEPDGENLIKRENKSSSIIFDSFQQVLLKYDSTIKSNENLEPDTISGNCSEQIIHVSSQNLCSQAASLKQDTIDDCEQKTGSLNNLTTISDGKKKTLKELNGGLSETLKMDIDNPAIFNIVSTMTKDLDDSVKSCEKKETDNANIEINDLPKSVENGNSHASDIIKLDPLKTSPQITNVNINDCSIPTNFELRMINGSKQNDGILNSLTMIDSSKNAAHTELNMNVAEECNMDVECLAVYAKEKLKCEIEIVSDLNGNSDSYIEESAILINDSRENTEVLKEKLPLKKNLNDYRDESDSWSDDDDSSSTSTDTSDSDFFQMVVESNSGSKNIPDIKTRGELGLEDLPPIEDLTITVPQEDMVVIGKIYAIVDKLVVVHAVKDLKPLDIDSVLFLSHDKPLGRVYDVFGPVIEPFYCIRFNSIEQINEKVTEIGADVFFAPGKEDITSYVFVDELQKVKGSDASWKEDNEPPEEHLDFSDDEEEKAARRKRMTKSRNSQFSTSSHVSAKRPFLMGDANSQQNLNCIPAAGPPQFSMNNMSSTPRFTALPAYPPPPSPSPSVCSVFTASNLPISSPYPSYPPPSPSPSVSSIFEAPRFKLFSSPYPTHPPPSPAPSVCSIMSIPMRPRTQGSLNFSNLKQPNAQFSQQPRLFSLPRPTMPSSNFQQPRTPSSQGVQQQSASPIVLQPLQMSFPPQNAIQRPAFPPQNAVQRQALPPQNAVQRPALPPQNPVQRPPLPPQNVMQRFPMPSQNVIRRPLFESQNIMQRPSFSPRSYQQRPPPLPSYQQTHVFGQVTLMSPLTALQPSLPPPASLSGYIPPPVSPSNYFHSPNPQGVPQSQSPYYSPNVSSNPWLPNASYSHVPPHHPLTVEIPNLSSPIPVNHFPPRNDTILPVVNNVIRNGQPPLY